MPVLQVKRISGLIYGARIPAPTYLAPLYWLLICSCLLVLSGCAEETRGVLKVFLENVIRDAVT